MEGWWAVSYAVMWLLVIVLTVVVVALARQIGTLHLRLGPRGALEIDTEGPPLDESPEPAELEDVSGRLVAIAGPGRPQLLLFVSPGCMVCEQVLPSLGAVASAGELAPIVITDVDRHETLRSYGRKRIDAPVVAAPELVAAYDVPGTPFVVVIDRLGVVRAKGTVNNLEQLEGLIDTARRRAIEAVPRAI
ncbi:MAG: thiol-disulfide isomerase [Gaiellales bacterium]